MTSLLYKTGFLLILLAGFQISAQAPKVHSHNDYEQTVPFWYALGAGASSIEADVFFENNELLVAHDKNEISKERTFENLYLKSFVHTAEALLQSLL